MATFRRNIYQAGIVAGSLLVAESRTIARLMLEAPDAAAWKQAIVVDNILQKRSFKTALRQALLIHNRLQLVKPSLWHIIAESAGETATQALLVTAIKDSRLLGDFLLRVVAARFSAFERELSKNDWQRFLEECEQLDSAVAGWADSTRHKLGEVVIRILTEAHYLDSARSRRIQPVTLEPEIRRYLITNNEDYILRAMSATGDLAR